MPKISFKPLPADYQELIVALKRRIVQCEERLIDYEHRHYNGIPEEALLYCLRHAIDLSKGCLAAAIEELPDSLATLSRAALETVFLARYVTLSKEKAQEFADGTLNELKKATRKNLRAGYAKIYDKETGEDKTTEFLASPFLGKIPAGPSIKDVARQGGLERVYTTIYGYISLIAHGRTFTLNRGPDYGQELYASISASLGALQCIEIITTDWITYRKQTPKEILKQILGI